MANPSNSTVQNLLPVQAYFDAQNNFITFIGQGQPFYASVNPQQSGLHITNSTIDSTTIGATTPSSAVFTSMATTTGTVSTQPVGANDIVNLLALQSYAAGISWKQPCAVATLVDITLSGLQTIDTYTTLAGDRVLVKNQANQADNGIYVAASGAWSRAIDADVWNEYVSAISFIEYGTQKGGAWFCTATPGGTLGVTPLIWSQFTTSATYTAGTGLTLTGSQFSITNTGVAANTYGSATATPVFAVNAQGQITSVTNTTITPAIGNVTGLATGMLAFLQTPTSANLAATVSDETGSGALVFATSPTLVTPALGTPASGVMTNVTGLPLTTGVVGTLPIGNGGTGQITASAAFNALSPITTAGDLIIGNGINSATRLSIGTNGQVLTSNGTTASWQSIAANVSSFSGGTTGLTPATATTGAITLAGTLAIANGGTGLTVLGTGVQTALGNAVSGSGSFALTTSPSFTTPILGTPQSGNFSTGTFTWPTFNQNTTGTAAGLSATLVVGSGGTGVTTLTGLAYGNGTAAFSAATAAQVVAVIGSTAVTNATNATNTVNIGITDDTTTAVSVYPIWVTTTTGNLPAKTASTKLSFVPSTGALSATSFSGAGTGLTGTASGLSIGGNAATATSATSATTATTANALNTANNYQVNSLGVGTAASGTAGEIRATNNVTAFYSSDISLKENVKNVENPLEIVCAIGSKTWDWTDSYIKEHGGEDGYFVTKSGYGVIAQEVEKAFPQAVRKRTDGTLAVDYEKLSTLAFGAIEQLVKRIEALEGK